MAHLSLSMKADELGKSLENLSVQLEAQLNQAVEDLANVAYASMVSQVQSRLKGTRQDYLRGLKFQNLGKNSYAIVLEGKLANDLEDGYESYDMKPGMLASQKVVGVGSRAGKDWVQTNKQGKKFAHVPFEHKPSATTGSAGDLAQDIKKMTAFNRQGTEQKITKTFKDDFGKPLVGKVATGIMKEGLSENIKGLTKFQSVSEKGRVRNLFMTWRTVSEDSSGWIHPGFSGLHLFEEAEKLVEKELENIIQTLL